MEQGIFTREEFMEMVKVVDRGMKKRQQGKPDQSV
jgi:hypothetical protein